MAEPVLALMRGERPITRGRPLMDPIHSWTFPDPPEAEVIVLDRILSGEATLRLVTHDAEDGAWQFLDGSHVFEEDAVIVLLGEIVQFDPSLAGLADLPVGSYAWRSDPSTPWQRAGGEPPATLDVD